MSNITSIEINKKKIEIPEKRVFIKPSITKLPITISVHNANFEDYEFDMTDYLPKDNHKYKVLFSGGLKLDSNVNNNYLGTVGCLSIKGSEHNYVRVCTVTKTAEVDYYVDGNAEIIIGTDRKLYIQRINEWYGNIAFLDIVGYTKID